MYAKFHKDRLRNGWDITLWNFAKTRTNKHTHKQTDMGITIPRPPPMGGEVIMVSSICLLLLRTKSIVNITFGICSYPPRVNTMTRSAVRPGCAWLILWMAVANSVAAPHLIEKPFFFQERSESSNFDFTDLFELISPKWCMLLVMYFCETHIYKVIYNIST